MHGLFNYDGPVVQSMTKAADCVILSVLWLVSSIPLVTMGASTTALYYSINKCIRRGESHVWREYWHSFGSNFKQATILWLPLLIVYALLGASLYSSYVMCVSGNLSKGMFYFLLVVIAIVIAWSSWLFPYIARFQNTNRNTLKNCSLIALFNLHITILQLIFFAAACAAVVFFPLILICAPGVYMVLSCRTLEPVFMKYMSEEDRAREEALNKGSK